MSSFIYTSLSSSQIRSKTPYFFIINESNSPSAFPHPQHTTTTFMDTKQLCRNCGFHSAMHSWWCTYDTEKALTLPGVTQQASPTVSKQKSLISKGYQPIAKTRFLLLWRKMQGYCWRALSDEAKTKFPKRRARMNKFHTITIRKGLLQG